MFKFIVVCAFAVVAAEPDPSLLLAAPLAQPAYSAYSYVSPAVTSISQHASSVIHPAPIAYSTPYAYSHLIKKRSPTVYAAPVSTYSAYNYYPYQYLAPQVVGPLVKQYPLVTDAHLPLATAHLIKKRSTDGSEGETDSTIEKRSPQIYGSPFIAPATSYIASSPYYPTPYSYAYNPYYANPALSLATAHLIKKRSVVPNAEAESQPEVDAQEEQVKKRSVFAGFPAPLAPVAYPYSTYYPGSPYQYFAPTTVIKSSPFAYDPIVYSTFIKK